MNIDWAHILTEVLAIVLPPLLTWLVAVTAREVRKLVPMIRLKYASEVNVNTRTMLEAFARTGVTLAEQLWRDPATQAAFASKHEMALRYIQHQLDLHNITINVEEMEALLESAVFTEINRGKGEAR